jgi:hypothetical protein
MKILLSTQLEQLYATALAPLWRNAAQRALISCSSPLEQNWLRQLLPHVPIGNLGERVQWWDPTLDTPIDSDTVYIASHPPCTLEWMKRFHHHPNLIVFHHPDRWNAQPWCDSVEVALHDDDDNEFESSLERVPKPSCRIQTISTDMSHVAGAIHVDGHSHPDVCLICQEEVTAGGVVETSCPSHRLCVDCWKGWSATCLSRPGVSCPYCRRIWSPHTTSRLLPHSVTTNILQAVQQWWEDQSLPCTVSERVLPVCVVLDDSLAALASLFPNDLPCRAVSQVDPEWEGRALLVGWKRRWKSILQQLLRWHTDQARTTYRTLTWDSLVLD